MSVVAVTGCSGYIGSTILQFLDADDSVSRIIGVDVQPPRVFPEKLEFHRMDIRDPALADLFVRRGVDRVIHLAFIVNPLHDEALMHDIDVGGTRNALGAAEACDARHLILASSTSAFGALPDNPEWLTEEHPPRRQPNYTYASDKYEVEGLARSFMERNPKIDVAVVRPCIVFGPHVDNYLSGLIFNLPVFPAIDGVRPEMQFVHEEDVAEVFRRIFEEEARGYFHAVGEGTVSLDRLCRMAGRRIVGFPEKVLYPAVDFLWKVHAPLITCPSGFIDFVRYRWTASDGKTREALGLGPRRSSDETVRVMLESKGVEVKA
jgi:UDP-glucose 4-epimerase